MVGGKGGNCSCICPISLGVALGVTSALAVFVWAMWGMYQGIDGVTWSATGMYMLVVAVKGFVFGFVLALIYDVIAKRCKGMCCRKSGNGDCK